MTWNYRVVRHNNNGFDWLALHEAYYDEDKDNPHSITVTPVSPIGEDINDLRSILGMMIAALEKPVLDYGSFESSNEKQKKGQE